MTDTPMGGFGTSKGTDFGGASSPSTGSMAGASGSTGVTDDLCPTCGGSRSGQNKGLDQFLGRLGISEEMVNNLKTSMQNVDMEQYLNTARDYLKNGSAKATDFAKENPGKVAAGVAVLAVGAGLLISALNRD